VRVVPDTNTIVSGVIGTGPPRQLVSAVRRSDMELAISPALLAELLDVLGRKNFAVRLAQAGLTAAGIVDELRALARVVALDPDDDQVLARALTAGVDLIVSGHKRDLLPLGGYQGMPIVSAKDAGQRGGLA
jgi:putative PIN family toxin of toxin-antitoxin system